MGLPVASAAVTLSVNQDLPVLAPADRAVCLPLAMSGLANHSSVACSSDQKVFQSTSIESISSGVGIGVGGSGLPSLVARKAWEACFQSPPCLDAA